MPGVARLNDSIAGTTSGEHSTHTVSPCSPSAISGSISGGCSTNVYCNGLPVATVGSVTTENDSCCGSAKGTVAAGSSKVFVNGKAIARSGDALNPHNGTASITGGSSNVIAN